MDTPCLAVKNAQKKRRGLLVRARRGSQGVVLILQKAELLADRVTFALKVIETLLSVSLGLIVADQGSVGGAQGGEECFMGHVGDGLFCHRTYDTTGKSIIKLIVAKIILFNSLDSIKFMGYLVMDA